MRYFQGVGSVNTHMQAHSLQSTRRVHVAVKESRYRMDFY